MKAASTSSKIHWSVIYFPFNSLWIWLLVNIACGMVLTFVFNPQDLNSWQSFALSSGGSAVIFITQWMGHNYLGAVLDTRVDWLEAPVKRFFLAILVMVVYTVVAFVTVSLLLHLILIQRIPNNLLQWAMEKSIVPLIISFVLGWGMASRDFYKSWRSSEIRARQLNAEMLNYRYELLRSQVNPHFLFNSFNVLSDLVYEDQDLAVKFIRQMSDLYRYVLDSREKELVPLEEELEFIRSFVFLLEIRFEEKLSVEIDVVPEPGEMIVPMTLQLLIENAVKHNVATKQKPLSVRVTRDGEGLQVQNNLQRRAVGDDSKKIGLQNLEQQYAHLSGKGIEVRENEESFWVRVPILKSKQV